MHPLVKQAARNFSPAILARLRRELPLLTGEALRDSVRALIFLGVLLSESGRDATALFELVESPPILTALDRATASRLAAQSNDAAKEKLSRFEGRRRTATREGESMRVEDLGARRFAGLRLR